MVADLEAAKAQMLSGSGSGLADVNADLRRFQIDEEDRRLSALSLRVVIESDEVELNRLRLEVERNRELLAEGIVGQSLFDTIEAAYDARSRLADLNASRGGQDPIQFGLGLHVGQVMHGNIGVPERVEFSVIGPAANEVARLEELTKSLGRDVLVSGAFADLLPLAWDDLGQHPVRGSTRSLAVLAPPIDGGDAVHCA